MRDPNQTLKEDVLGAISNDFENLESIVDHLNYFAPEYGGAVDPQRIVNALGELVSERHARAYVFTGKRSPEPTTYSPQRVRELWFYVTPEGKQLAKRLQEEWSSQGGAQP